MLTKPINWFGRQCTLVCDGRCDKSWGINNRPKLFYMESEVPRELESGEDPVDCDDYVFKADDALETAPRDPGTYEGGYGKPSGSPLENPTKMNKWCSRECERSSILEEGEPVVLRTIGLPNKRHRRLV